MAELNFSAYFSTLPTTELSSVLERTVQKAEKKFFLLVIDPPNRHSSSYFGDKITWASDIRLYFKANNLKWGKSQHHVMSGDWNSCGEMADYYTTLYLIREWSRYWYKIFHNNIMSFLQPILNSTARHE